MKLILLALTTVSLVYAFQETIALVFFVGIIYGICGAISAWYDFSLKL
jgi:hypothetical protein